MYRVLFSPFSVYSIFVVVLTSSSSCKSSCFNSFLACRYFAKSWSLPVVFACCCMLVSFPRVRYVLVSLSPLYTLFYGCLLKSSFNLIPPDERAFIIVLILSPFCPKFVDIVSKLFIV